MRYDLIFIGTALAALLVGEGIGIYMGVAQDFTFVPVHVHLNLLGWVTLALFGVLHRLYPQLGASRMAMAQCALAIIASLAMPAGLAIMLITQDATLVKLASLAVILGTILFIVMFARSHTAKRDARLGAEAPAA
jgi:hypothetical protein